MKKTEREKKQKEKSAMVSQETHRKEKSAMVSQETHRKEKSETSVAEALCKDRDCPFHGELKVHGRTFEGVVKSRFDRRIAIEFERMVYVKKYERYMKRKTKIHARLPTCLENEIHVGDVVRVQECRPLSKIIHFAVVKKIKSGTEKKIPAEALV